VRDLDTGVVVYAKFTSSRGTGNAGPHNALILTARTEIEASGQFEVAVISSQDRRDIPAEYRVEVCRGVLNNVRKQCWVYCSWLRPMSVDGEFEIGIRKAHGTFLRDVLVAVNLYKSDMAEGIIRPPQS
jgi:hypothetical protein